MKTAFITLALIPIAFAAEGIKLWNQGGNFNADEMRCYATIDNNSGCNDACKRNGARHVFFDASHWWAGTHNGKFTDPRKGDDVWLDIHPESDTTWGVYHKGGDGTRIGWCQKTNDKSCECDFVGVSTGSASAFAYCEMYED
ncbi:hypothetical protein DICA3_F33210 [Diutina catenulata]